MSKHICYSAEDCFSAFDILEQGLGWQEGNRAVSTEGGEKPFLNRLYFNETDAALLGLFTSTVVLPGGVTSQISSLN